MRCRLVLFVRTSLAFAVPARAGEPEDFFEKKVRPVLVEHCYECHSDEAKLKGKLKDGLLLDSKDGLRKGGDSGPAIVPR